MYFCLYLSSVASCTMQYGLHQYDLLLLVTFEIDPITHYCLKNYYLAYNKNLCMQGNLTSMNTEIAASPDS